MSFTLTREHVAKLTVAAAEGNPGPLLGAIDPDVVWQVGASAEEGKGRSGVYSLASFGAMIVPSFARVFEAGFPKLITDSIEIVGNKAVLEARGEGQTFKAGTYRNRVVMVLEFSPATGKIVRLNEYLDTAALYAVMDAHGV